MQEGCPYVVLWKRKRMGILMVKAGNMARGMAPKKSCSSFAGQPRRSEWGYAFQTVQVM